AIRGSCSRGSLMVSSSVHPSRQTTAAPEGRFRCAGSMRVVGPFTGGRTSPSLALELFRAGIHHGPEVLAVLDPLHFQREATVPLDPVFHGGRIIGHQVSRTLGARDLETKRPAPIQIRLMEA